MTEEAFAGQAANQPIPVRPTTCAADSSSVASPVDAPRPSAKTGRFSRLRRQQPQSSLPPRAMVALWLVILAFVLTFAILAVRRHAALASNGMDLGNVNQALWNTAHGDFMAFTNMAPVGNRLALHVEPILLLFVPLYWIGLGGPRLLLIVQAIVVGLGAWPLYRLAGDVLGGRLFAFSAKSHGGRRPGEGEVQSDQANDRVASVRTSYSLLLLVFPIAYLLMPALEAAVMYDFHAVTLAPTFLLFAFYFLERDRRWLFALCAVLAMACKEDMGLTVAMLGLYALIARRRWPLGGAAIAAGVAWFVIAVFLIQPHFSPTGGNVQAERYQWLGETPLAMLGTVVSRPALIWDHVWRQANLPAYLGGLLLPTAFLAVLSPLTWLPALPSLAINLLSDYPFSWRLEDFHYAAPVVPFVLISTIYGVRCLARLVGRRWPPASYYVVMVACGFLLIAAVGYHWGRGFSPLSRPFQPWSLSDHHRKAHKVFRQVPADAALFAQSNLNPHVSSRRVLYHDPATLTESGLADDLATSGFPRPDYLLFDVSSLVNKDDFQRVAVAPLMESGSFRPLVADNGFLLLEQSPQGESAVPLVTLPDPFLDFVRADPAHITYPVVADVGDAVRLHGFDLHFNRAEEVQPVLYLEALRPLDEDYFVSLYLLDEWGSPLGATLEDQPALVWYPTSHWQAGELVKVTFNTLPWYTRDTSAYRLALGVMHGPDPWQPSARLLPSLPPSDTEGASPYAIRLPDDGTLLELARFRQVFGMPEGGPRERQYRPPRMQTAVNRSLGGQIRLLGYDLTPITCDGPADLAQAGDCWLDIVLYWQAEKFTDTDYKVFVHLVGPYATPAESQPADAQIWAQRDACPDSGGYPTRRWATGEVVADPVRIDLPNPLPPGSFDLVIGMYHPDTGQRLPVLDAAGQPVDDKIVVPQMIRVPDER